MGLTLDFRPRVRNSDAKADTVEHDDIRQIVADVSDLFASHAGVRHNLFDDRNLLRVALVDVVHLRLFRPLVGRLRDAPADDTGADALGVAPLQSDPVLGIEALKLHHLAVRAGDEIEFSISQHAIHIHKKQLDFRRAGYHVRGRHRFSPRCSTAADYL